MKPQVVHIWNDPRGCWWGWRLLYQDWSYDFLEKDQATYYANLLCELLEDHRGREASDLLHPGVRL